MSTPPAETRHDYMCLWRTHSNSALNRKGEITVQARNLIDAIAAAKSLIHGQTGIGISHIVVYEVEEAFL